MLPFIPLKSAYERATQALQAAEGALSNLPEPLQNFLLVYSAQGLIDNGGFQYFFEMDWPGNPEYVVFSKAYRAIGAEDAAHCIEQAAALFGFAHPEQFESERMQFMKGLPEDHAFFRLGDSVCGDASIWAALSAYVNRHPEAFSGLGA